MEALINDFTPTYKPGRMFPTAVVFTVTTPWLLSELTETSITIKNYESKPSKLNGRIIGLIEDIAELKDNWDGEGTPAISSKVLSVAKSYIKTLDGAGQEIFNVSPGPQGEIMVSMKNNDKYMELLFYPDRNKYVKFNPGQRAEQGPLNFNVLSSLIAWMNGN